MRNESNNIYSVKLFDLKNNSNTNLKLIYELI